MVAALIMGAVIRPRRAGVKIYPVMPGRCGTGYAKTAPGASAGELYDVTALAPDVLASAGT